MATRRRSSASKTAKPIVSETVTKVTPIRAKRVNKTTRSAKIVTETVTQTPKVEEKTTPNLTKLRGFDFVVLPLIYLEAFVVNILQNLSLNVPVRVAIK